MSAPTKPFAKGSGILLGIITLWAACLALFLVGKMLLKMLLSGGGDAGV
jgi:hypothetical protein